MPRPIPIPPGSRALSRALALALLALASVACRTETTTSPRVHETEIAHAAPGRIWEVREDGTLRGYVVRFSEAGDDGRVFFSVRNPSHQELGLIDGQGRCYRYHAHERTPTWLGTGTVVEGARRILDAGERAELVEEGVEGA